MSSQPAAGRPLRDAVRNRAPTRTLAAVGTRRTHAEVIKQKAQAAQAAVDHASAKETNLARQHAAVAGIEDRARRQEQKKERQAMRPDLIPANLLKIQPLTFHVVAQQSRTKKPVSGTKSDTGQTDTYTTAQGVPKKMMTAESQGAAKVNANANRQLPPHWFDKSKEAPSPDLEPVDAIGEEDVEEVVLVTTKSAGTRDL
ncbi:hypothetical protein CPC08DRAFT_771178 [Agrocybe pediades]|nr:hypothetical protein CPC08DRAFT_771178 [Agrocybe pediades]